MTTVTSAFFCVHGIIAKSITIHIFFQDYTIVLFYKTLNEIYNIGTAF